LEAIPTRDRASALEDWGWIVAVDHQRVSRALGGDADAVHELTELLTPVIHSRVARVLLRQLGRQTHEQIRQEVEDITQDVFLALFEHDGRILRSWDPERGASLTTFVGLVAERRTISRLRRRTTNPWVEEATSDEELEQHLESEKDLESTVATRQLMERLASELEQELSPKGSLLFSLLLVEQRPVAEVCELMEMRPDAVYAWRSRLARRVRALAEKILSDNGSARRSQ
jgi:RNA polymerase sigma-70 factor (ECF subfamily)